MKHSMLIIVPILAIAPSIGAQNTTAGVELEAARQAIQRADYDGALPHARAVTDAAVAELRVLPPTAEVVTPPIFEASATGPAKLLNLVDQTKQALAERDMVKVREYAVALTIAIFKQKEWSAPSPADNLSQLEQNSIGKSAFQIFLMLPDLSKAAYSAGDLMKALSYANQLLATASVHPNWAQGMAIHYGNIVAGRVALVKGDVASAKAHLIAAGLTPGSPSLNTFGPNMALAQELLGRGERSSVVQYLSECHKFWKLDNGKVDQWTTLINQGKTPDFGANISY